MSLFAILAGLATGLVLGLFGSGGSIIALPALLYLLQVEPKSAIAMSLGVVAVTATVSGLDSWRRGLVDVRIAFVFGLFGVAGTFAGARLGLLTTGTTRSPACWRQWALHPNGQPGRYASHWVGSPRKLKSSLQPRC
jgi:uncharacterized membrane protein YfcA